MLSLGSSYICSAIKQPSRKIVSEKKNSKGLWSETSQPPDKKTIK